MPFLGFLHFPSEVFVSRFFSAGPAANDQDVYSIIIDFLKPWSFVDPEALLAGSAELAIDFFPHRELMHPEFAVFRVLVLDAVTTALAVFLAAAARTAVILMGKGDLRLSFEIEAHNMQESSQPLLRSDPADGFGGIRNPDFVGDGRWEVLMDAGMQGIGENVFDHFGDFFVFALGLEIHHLIDHAVDAAADLEERLRLQERFPVIVEMTDGEGMHSLGLDLGPEFLDSLQFLGILLVRLKEAFDGDLELRICVAYDERVRMIEFRLLEAGGTPIARRERQP